MGIFEPGSFAVSAFLSVLSCSEENSKEKDGKKLIEVHGDDALDWGEAE